MPCNNLVVQAAKLEMTPALMRAVFSNPNALEALATALAGITNERRPVTVWNSAFPTNFRSNYGDTTQRISLERIAGPHAYMDFVGPGTCIRVHADGRTELRDGWSIGARDPKYLEDFNASLRQIAIYVAQAMIAQTLAPITVDDQRVNGARILTVNI